MCAFNYISCKYSVQDQIQDCTWQQGLHRCGLKAQRQCGPKVSKEPRASESWASGGATPVGLHWPYSGAAPPPTHSLGEEGSWATDLAPHPLKDPGDYNKEISSRTVQSS